MNNLIASFWGAVLFYTNIYLPKNLQPDFVRICRWLTLVGLLIGILLGFTDFILTQINMPILTRSVLIIAMWIYLTGGLHLDGVLDTADGLAIVEPSRRLEVMKDSLTGAFGVIAGVILLLIKTVALSDIDSQRWLILIITASWSRWGQLMAIAFYPYLRETGKGAFHKESLVLPQDCLTGSIFIIFLILAQFFFTNYSWWLILLTQLACAAIALFIGYWFNLKLGGHTGDTYGATVEWSEAFILCLFTIHY